MPYSSDRLIKLVQDDHTGEVIDLENQLAARTMLGSDRAFEELIRRTLTAWTRSFGGPDQSALPGDVLRRILDVARASVRRLLDDLADRAPGILAGGLAPAVAMGVRQGVEFVRAASGRRRRTPAVPSVSRVLRNEARRVRDMVVERRDRALFLLHPDRVSRWSHMLAGLGAARAVLPAVRAHIAWVINTAVHEGLDAVVRATAPLRVWVSESDACVRCLAYTGRTALIGEPFPGGRSWDPRQRQIRVPGIDGPPLHAHCFPAGTVASGPGVRAATDRWYTGEMVEVRTRGGRVLTVTPNHPVLTAKGWVAAGLLHEGSQVVSDRSLESVLGRNPDDHQKPTLIEDVARALRSSSGVMTVRMPVAPEDFHGDGSDGQVDVVWADRLLRSWPEIPEPFGEQHLCRAHAGLVALSGEREPDPMLSRLWTPAQSRVSSLSVGAAFLGGSAGGEESVGFGLSPEAGTLLGQEPLNHSARYAFAVRNALDALAALVTFDQSGDRGDDRDAYIDALAAKEVVHRLAADSKADGKRAEALTPSVTLDDVVSVRRFPWSGHVYNLETSGGWYIANGILVHNCRCRAVPWDDSWTTDGIPFPLALEREAHRSLAYGRARPSESRAARLRAARELLRTVDDLLPAVEERARTAIRAGRFQAAA